MCVVFALVLRSRVVLHYQTNHFKDLGSVGVHVGLRLPQHVDQLQVALLVHSDVRGHLRIEPVPQRATGRERERKTCLSFM